MGRSSYDPTGSPAGLPRQTRRQTLKIAAAGLAASTAAAAVPYIVSAQGVRAFHGAWPYDMPPVGHYNSFVPQAITLGIYWDLMEQPLGMYYWQEQRWLPLLATEWATIPPDTFSVRLRQGVTWSDGSRFTAQDVLTTWTLGRLLNWVPWRFLDRVEAVDAYTVNFIMSRPTSVMERYVLRERVRAHSVYGEWAARVQGLLDAGLGPDSEEWRALRAEFNNFKPRELVGTGPFKIDPRSITEAQLTLVKVPTAWNAAQIGFDRIVLYNGETPTVTPVVLAKNVDYATHGFPPATEQQFARLGLRILRPPVFNGPAILINYNDPALAPLRRKEVRQALMYAINREENARISLAASGVPLKVIAGFSDNLVPLWLTNETISVMNPYPYDPARAESILLGLGFRRGPDGVWQDPDGNRMEYELLFQAEFADTGAGGKSFADQLTKFGVKITPRAITFTQFNNEVFAGRFQLATGGWGAAHPHPHFSFVQDFLFYNPPQAPGPGMGLPMLQQTDALGEIDLQSLTLQTAEGLDVAAQRDLVGYLALAFNELLPSLPIYERYGNNPVLDGVRVTGWPPDDDPIYKNSPYADSFVIMMLYEGRLRPAR